MYHYDRYYHHGLTLLGQYMEGYDKAGLEPKSMHSLRVSLLGKTPEERLLGLVHDLVEDTVLSHDDFWTWPRDVRIGLVAITRNDREIYFDYIKRLMKNNLARNVKIHDINDNLARLHTLSDIEQDSMKLRYTKALKMLEEI